MHFSSLEPYFAADPLLLYDFIYICPESEYVTLFSKIPGFLSLRCLTFIPVPLVKERVRCYVIVKKYMFIHMYFQSY